MLNGTNTFELSSIAFWQAYRAYSAEQQSHSGVGEEALGEAEVHWSARKRFNSLFGRQSSGNLATSYQTSAAGAK